mgnify:CR=1 FL=1
MLPSDALWPAVKPPTFERVGTTQPFNYRDTLSLLDYVNQIVKHVKSLQSDIDADLDIVDTDLDTMQTALSGMLVDMANLRDELISLIKNAASGDNLMIRSSVYGSQKTVQDALDDVYDADRPFGLFASDFDSFNFSPSEFDALQVSPREFDLRSVDAINAVAGDITINDVWWLKEHGLTFGDLIKLAQDYATSASNSLAQINSSMTTLSLIHWCDSKADAIAKSTADPNGIYFAPEG